MATFDIVSRPCEDACATITTDKTVQGAPIYRCPGCDAEWIELNERTDSSAPPPATSFPDAPTPPASEAAADADSAGAQASPPLPRPIVPAGPPVHPTMLQTVLDARDIRALAEFYRALLGLVYRPGDAPHFSGSDEPEWLGLTHHDGTPALAFSADDHHVPPTWPGDSVPRQLHLDFAVPDRAALESARALAESLGARVLDDRSRHAEEALYVFADPAGHPFCIVVP